MSDKTETAPHPPFPQFLEDFRKKLQHLFYIRADIDQLSTKRGLPPFMLREILSESPLATYIPSQHGGRGGHIHEGIALTAAASYESLPLSLGFGINWALFLQPVAKYADDQIKPGIFNGFIKDRKMGGLMITEPDFGSDALHMQSSYSDFADHYHIQGTKHWAGLTGWADYWLLTARKKRTTASFCAISTFLSAMSTLQIRTSLSKSFMKILVSTCFPMDATGLT